MTFFFYLCQSILCGWCYNWPREVILMNTHNVAFMDKRNKNISYLSSDLFNAYQRELCMTCIQWRFATYAVIAALAEVLDTEGSDLTCFCETDSSPHWVQLDSNGSGCQCWLQFQTEYVWESFTWIFMKYYGQNLSPCENEKWHSLKDFDPIHKVSCHSEWISFFFSCSSPCKRILHETYDLKEVFSFLWFVLESCNP